MPAETLSMMATASPRQTGLLRSLPALLALLALPAAAADDAPGPWSLRLGLADVSVPMDVSVNWPVRRCQNEALTDAGYGVSESLGSVRTASIRE
jgi:hypothetical protein